MATYLVVDVSKYQTITSYADAAANVDGVIMRIGYRGYSANGTCVKDPKFETHYNGFKGQISRNGNPIKIGYYWFSTAITKEEAEEEADFCAQLLSGKQCDMPVYFDSEFANGGSGRSDGLSFDARTQLCWDWGWRLVSYGYRVGLYASQAWFGYRIDYNGFKDSNWSMWVARYSTISPTWPDYDGWQYTSSGSITGITGNVDLSRFYKDVAGWEGDGKTNISTKNIYLEPTSFTYTGSSQTPSAIIEGLTLGVDYKVSFDNTVNAGTATATFVGIGDYEGTVTKEYTINPRPITHVQPYLQVSSFTYTGQELKPIVGFKGSTESVIPSTIDYQVTYSSNVNVGTGYANVLGKNNFDGYISLTFTITKADISNKNIYPVASTYEYTGNPINAALYLDGLELGISCDIQYSDNIDIGTAYATVTGIGNYTGIKVVPYEIIEKEMPTSGWYLSQTLYMYDGTEHTPDALKDGMELDRDYTVEYVDNIDAGRGTVIVTGKGIYQSETVTLHFNISKAPMDMSVFELAHYEAEYSGQPIENTVANSGEYVYGEDYEFELLNNINAGDAICRVTAINNYVGEKDINYTILPLDLTKHGQITCGEPSVDGIYDNDNFAVYCDGVLLDDYENYVYDFETIRYPVNSTYTYTVWIVTGIANYTGQIREEFLTTIDGIKPDVPRYVPKTRAEETDSLSIPADVVLDGGDIELPEPEPETPGEITEPTGDISDISDKSLSFSYNYIDNPEPVIPEDPENNDEVLVIYPSGSVIQIRETKYYSSAHNIYPEHNLLESGYYYIYNYRVVNERIRICNSKESANVPGECIGWIDISAISSTASIRIGDAVIINSFIYLNPYYEDRGRIIKTGQKMYIVKIAIPIQWELGNIDTPEMDVDEILPQIDFGNIDEDIIIEDENDIDFNVLSYDYLDDIGNCIGVANLPNQEPIGWIGLNMFKLV